VETPHNAPKPAPELVPDEDQSDEFQTVMGWSLAGLCGLALLLGVGPGIEQVNSPEPWLGLPAIYAWAAFWAGGLCLTLIFAFWFVWPSEDDPW